jgi:hypothetical protein
MCDACGVTEECSPENCESCEMAVICEVKDELWDLVEKYGIGIDEMLIAVQGLFVDAACFCLEEGDDAAFQIEDQNVQAIGRAVDEIYMNYETTGVTTGVSQ